MRRLINEEFDSNLKKIICVLCGFVCECMLSIYMDCG